MKKLIAFPSLIVMVSVLLFSFKNKGSEKLATSAPLKPFPQSINYKGCIKPELAQSELNKDVSSYYDYWKSMHLKGDLKSLSGGYYVAGHNTGSSDGFKPLGSSEGVGYGMLITSLMAGYDKDAQILFDGLFKTARAFKSRTNPNLMGWVVADDQAAQGHFSSATDGDMDIAYALLLAHNQWGSKGRVNYLSEAKKMITDGLKASYITTNKQLNVGDWDRKNSLRTRPSDWMMSHMRAFGIYTEDKIWEEVIDNLYQVYNVFSEKYSPNTGLVTDFIVNDPPEPCPPNFLNEYPGTNTYSFNACRVPLRVSMDYAFYGSQKAYDVSDKIVSWLKVETDEDPTKIKSGYNLDGSATRTSSSTAFTGPFIAASIVNPENQEFLNKGWQMIKNDRSSYYGDSLNLLSMLFISGNWWIPTS
jgi:endo-1,4-beta-D-glucanase Y